MNNTDLRAKRTDLILIEICSRILDLLNKLEDREHKGRSSFCCFMPEIEDMKKLISVIKMENANE